jgi:hypothetical protein
VQFESGVDRQQQSALVMSDELLPQAVPNWRAEYGHFDTQLSSAFRVVEGAVRAL